MDETVELCTTCGELTPHTRRRHAPRRVCAAVLGLAAVGLVALAFVRETAVPVALAVPFAFVALALRSADRARHWELACTRCRGKALVAEQRLRFPLRATIIDWF